MLVVGFNVLLLMCCVYVVVCFCCCLTVLFDVCCLLVVGVRLLFGVWLRLVLAGGLSVVDCS